MDNTEIEERLTVMLGKSTIKLGVLEDKIRMNKILIKLFKLGAFTEEHEEILTMLEKLP